MNFEASNFLVVLFQEKNVAETGKYVVFNIVDLGTTKVVE